MSYFQCDRCGETSTWVKKYSIVLFGRVITTETRLCTYCGMEYQFVPAVDSLVMTRFFKDERKVALILSINDGVPFIAQDLSATRARRLAAALIKAADILEGE